MYTEACIGETTHFNLIRSKVDLGLIKKKLENNQIFSKKHEMFFIIQK